MPERTCSVNGCDRPFSCKGYCTIHYARWKRTGDPGPVDRMRSPYGTRPRCRVDGCERPARAQTLCKMHYNRWLTYGDPGEADQRKSKEIVSYSGAHKRVRRLNGSASVHECCSCGAPAEEWAYDHSDPSPLWERNMPYSLASHRYQPMCKQCHVALDASQRYA